MEPKPESLWWTSSFEEEDKITLKVGGGGKEWNLPFREVFEVLEYRFQCDRKCTQGVEKDIAAKGWAAVGATLKFIARKVFL